MKDHCVYHVSPVCREKLEMTEKRYREQGNCCVKCSSWMEKNPRVESPIKLGMFNYSLA